MKENNIVYALFAAMGAMLVLLLATNNPVWFLLFLFLNCVLSFKYNKYYFLLFLVYAAFNYYYSYLVPRGAWHETFLQKIIKDLFAMFIYVSWVFEMLIKKKIAFPRTSVAIPLMMFLALAFIGLVRSVPDNLFLGIAGFRNMAVFVPIFFVSAYYIRDKRDISKMLNVLFCVGFAVAVLGIFEFFFSPVIAEKVFFESFAGLFMRRITSTMLYPGNLSIFMVILSVLLYGLYAKGIYLINKNISRVFLFSYVFTAFLTYARSGIIALAIAAIYILWKEKKYKTLLSSAIVLIMLAAGFYMLMPSAVWRYSRFVDQFTSDRSVAVRASLWGKPIELAEKDPFIALTGIGIDKVGTVVTASQFDEKSVGSEFIQPDNYFLQLILSIGVFGAAFFILALILLFYEGDVAYRTSKDEYLKAVSLSLKALLLVYTVAGMTGSVWETFPNSMYFWALMGLIPSIIRMNRTSVEFAEKKGPLYDKRL